jgi:hypothetical protein
MRIQHSIYTTPSPPRSFWDWLSGRSLKDETQGHFYGGTGTSVLVSGPLDSSRIGGAYTSESEPEEWNFTVLKADGSAINSGDEVSLRINSGKLGRGPFFFQSTAINNEIFITGDGTAPFGANTTYVIEFGEVMNGLGWRPPSVNCQLGSTLSGSVMEASTGQPIANALVVATGVLENHDFRARTDGNGAFALMDADGRNIIPAGNGVSLDVTINRYESKRDGPFTMPDHGSVVRTILLESTKVRGRVIDEMGNPISGAIVIPVTPLNGRILTAADGTQLVATTQADGTFVLDSVPHGAATLWVSYGLLVNTNMSIPNVPPEGLMGIVIKLPPAPLEIVGTVSAYFPIDTFNPLEGVQVQVVNSYQYGITDKMGKYRILPVPSGAKDLLVSQNGYLSILVEAVPGSVTPTVRLLKPLREIG